MLIMAKKIAIGILVLILIFGGVIAYFYFFKKPATTDTGQGFSLQDLFPFTDTGSNTITPPPTDTTQTPPTDTTPDTTVTRPRLRLITKGPVAGAVVYDVTRPKATDPEKPAIWVHGKPPPIEIESVPFIRFIEKASGHISELFFDQLGDPDKTTNTTIPKVYEGLFAKTDGTVAILRYADDDKTIQTYSGSMPAKIVPLPTQTPTTPQSTPAETSTTPPIIETAELKGSYLAQNITALSVSPDGKNIFTVTQFDDGITGTISLPDGTKKNPIISNAYTEWISQWPTAKMITLTTKASANVPGYMYSVDPDKKVLKKVLGGVLGLTTNTSPDGKNILFSMTKNKQLVTSLYNTATKDVVGLPGITTIPEKCLWQSATILYCAVPSYIPGGDYPDLWYQGGVLFSDQIYKIDIKTFDVAVIANPADVQATIDAVNLSVDPKNTTLIFTNKKDGSLWGLDLTPPTISTTTTQ
jgi:hypothetical protein